MPCDGCALCYMDTPKTISAMVVGLFENAVALAVDDAILE